MRFVLLAPFLAVCLCAAGGLSGPLRVDPGNPRYFTDGSGHTIYLTGSHTWNTVIDMRPANAGKSFNFDAFLDWVAGYGHNFIRLWTWELTNWNTRGNNPAHRERVQKLIVSPLPWARTGPGAALDGKPKFDLERFDDRYFRRLRSRAVKAGRRGFYVSVMLFEGWGLQFSPGAWAHHPMNPANNINGIDGDGNGDGSGVEVHTLENARITAIQERYIRKVIDTVNDLDNVLYEISNENHPPSTQWQYHMIRFIHEYEKRKLKQHPVGMTFQYKGGSNQALFDSPADWIAPNPEGGYRNHPPASDGSKVILSDTDHLWGIGGNADWAWKSFLRGLNPLFMDTYDGSVLGRPFDPRFEALRRTLGYTLRYARRMNLARVLPHGELSSSGYCLADPGREYLVFLPGGGSATVDLSAVSGTVAVEWFDPTKGKTTHADPVSGGARRPFTAPFRGSAVVYLKTE